LSARRPWTVEVTATIGRFREVVMRQNAKAIVSALVSGIIAFLSSLLTAFQGQTTGFDTITAGQWVTAVLAFFIGLGITGSATYRVPNGGPHPPAHP
jgi:hypothetical protein